MFRRILRVLLRTLLMLLVGIALYLLSAFALSRIPVAGEPQVDGQVTVYLLSNGVHTDLVLPLRNEVMDWESFVPAGDTRGGDTTLQWVAFGWGDKGFYMEVPEWSDLTARVAFRAAFGLSGSAMHVTRHPQPEEGEQCRRTTLDAAHYARLVEQIKGGFKLEADHASPTLIPTDAVYGDTDAFYEGTGRYSLFHTCNTWTNSALKRSGMKACVWTPIDTGILQQYR